jgi:hypothetical protein
MAKFKVGDKVVFKTDELSREWYREQAVGVGTVEKIVDPDCHNELNIHIRWSDDTYNGYASCDLIHYKEPTMSTRTIPTKEQVLEAAKRCPQTKEALEILFPEDFKEAFNWSDFYKNPFAYIKVVGIDTIELDKTLLTAFIGIGKRIPTHLYPCVHLGLLIELLTFMDNNAPRR